MQEIFKHLSLKNSLAAILVIIYLFIGFWFVSIIDAQTEIENKRDFVKIIELTHNIK